MAKPNLWMLKSGCWSYKIISSAFHNPKKSFRFVCVCGEYFDLYSAFHMNGLRADSYRNYQKKTIKTIKQLDKTMVRVIKSIISIHYKIQSQSKRARPNQWWWFLKAATAPWEPRAFLLPSGQTVASPSGFSKVRCLAPHQGLPPHMASSCPASQQAHPGWWKKEHWKDANGWPQ